MRDRRLNSKYLPGVPLHENVTPCWTIEEALAGAWLVLFSVPSHIVRGLARDVAPHISGEQAVLNAGKGLEEGTDKRMSEVLAEELPRSRGIAAMGGPAIATEFARGVPTAVIVAAPTPPWRRRSRPRSRTSSSRWTRPATSPAWSWAPA